jgi:hypothetical protein
MERLLITFICAQLSVATGPNTQYGPACNNLLTAASISTGVQGDLNLIQKNAEKLARREVIDKTGEFVWQLGAAFYTTVGSKQIQLSTPVKPVADSLSLTANPNSQTVSLSWSF